MLSWPYTLDKGQLNLPILSGKADHLRYMVASWHSPDRWCQGRYRQMNFNHLILLIQENKSESLAAVLYPLNIQNRCSAITPGPHIHTHAQPSVHVYVRTRSDSQHAWPALPFIVIRSVIIMRWLLRSDLYKTRRLLTGSVIRVKTLRFQKNLKQSK